MSLSSTGGNVPGNITIPSSDIWQIEYKMAGKLQLWWAVAGFVVGALVGAGADAATYDESYSVTSDADSRSDAALKDLMQYWLVKERKVLRGEKRRPAGVFGE